MTPAVVCRVACGLFLLTSACTLQVGGLSEEDSGLDRGMDAGPDAAVVDARERVDAGDGADAGEPSDGGGIDAGGADAGGIDAGPVEGRLPALRLELPCVPPSSSGASTCTTASDVETDARMTGEAGREYDVEIRIRGVVETHSYRNGADDGFWYVGGRNRGDAWNDVGLEVDDPGGSWFLNNGPGGLFYCWALDYTRTIPIRTGARVRLYMGSTNTATIANRDELGDPIVVPGIPPAPGAFDGQFVQIDQVSATPR